MEYVLGIDAGATKTTAIIADEAGNILGKAFAGSASLQTNTEEEIKSSIQDAINSAKEKAGKDIGQFSAASVGMAGTDTPELQKKAHSIMSSVVPLSGSGDLVVVNDTKLVLPAGSDNNFGIAVISGTGSNFYGKNKEGEEAWAGGLGHILADEGSGYWIGLRVLRAAVRSADGRGEKTLLEDLVLGKFQVKTIRELAEKEHEKKSVIAEVSLLADEAYRRGDDVAESIFNEAAHELALGINAVIERLGMEKDEFDIVAVGGTFNSPYPFSKKIMEEVKAKKAKFIICREDPAYGAVKIALKTINK